MFSSRWGALFSVDDFGERDTNSWRVAVQTHHALVLQIPCEVRSLGTSLTHSKTTCRRERREHKGCIYIYVICVSLGKWFWNVEIHSVHCFHICFWFEVVSNSWTSKLKKQNSGYLIITKGSWEQIYLATKKTRHFVVSTNNYIFIGGISETT